MRAKAVTRIRIVTTCILAVALILIGRLYQVQILDDEKYLAQAEGQYVHTVQDLYSRGNIYFTTKDGEKVSAATVKSGYLLAIDASRITDPEGLYTSLSALIPLEREDFIARAKRTDRKYQEIVPQIDVETSEKIKALDLEGVSLYRTQWRYYPGDELAARTIGFVGYDGTELAGRYGIERYYDDKLVRDDDRLSVNFFAEIFSNLGELVFESKEDEEGDLVTSIEPTVARTLDRVLLDVQNMWQSELTGGIIMNPKTGEIYALEVLPTFNLNDRSGVPITSFPNPLVESVYELGSIIKPLTVAAGLDAGAINAQSTYYDAGFMELDGKKFSNFDGVGRGTVPIQEILSQSLNTGVAHIVQQMGKERFREYFLNLKLGSETGIDLPGEAHGLVQNLQSPRDIEYATASFGQGIALTPIAAVRALSTLANGGTLITPHIVREIEYKNGKQHQVGFPPGERIFKEETSEEITRMLVEVVDSALKGGTVTKEHYAIAAKTGTAQMADSAGGGYSEDKFLHSFFGYFPAYDPQFLIFLYTTEPKGVRYASETLTDPFMELAEFLINYYDLPPDR